MESTGEKLFVCAVVGIAVVLLLWPSKREVARVLEIETNEPGPVIDGNPRINGPEFKPAPPLAKMRPLVTLPNGDKAVRAGL